MAKRKKLVKVTITPNKTVREAILDSAKSAVLGSREVAYGKPEANFTRIARLINAHLQNRFGMDANQITAGDVAMLLIQVKAGRLGGNMTHLDSWVDIAGYAACGGEIE